MNGEISITVEDRAGEVRILHVPTDMSLSLMEILKAEEYPILATCGGMALCATCHVQVLSGYDNLPDASNDEWMMLDTLPALTDTSRLACQLKIADEMDGMIFRIMGEDNI